MNTSYKWIKSMVPGLDVSPREYMNAMTLSGSKVEFYEEMDADLDKIVIGQVEEIVQHPDADKLVICQVNIGSEKIQIVTGAPNVVVGMKVPVVLDGGKVAGGHDGKKTPGGIKIKKGKLRGIESNGMMCSIDELGSSCDFYPDAAPDGLYGLPADAPIGEDAVKYLGLDDVSFEYEITSNRVDCFSVMGIAREAAATFRLPFEPPVIKETGNSEDVNDYIKVSVKDPDLCRRYTARVVKNIKIAPSPEWMQRRLAAHGIRPINNLVDITNYVMEEMGQPMHAYDLSTIAGNEIIVRRAEKGEKFITLDGAERTLDDSILMICDGEKSVGLAGIMGGENSMITDNVSTMLFEAACFDGTNIRLSSKKIGLRTDASSKFEKGLDPNLAMEAMNRACALIEELGCGEVVGGAIDVYPNPKVGFNLPFEPDKYNRMLGTDISVDTMLEYFDRLDVPYNKDTNELCIPTWRQDLESYADLAEEVARFYGYDNIGTTLPHGESTTGGKTFKQRIEDVVKDTALACGFSQAMCFSFESPKVYDKLLIPADDARRNAVVINNPLGEDYSIMRSLPVNYILTSLATNLGHRNKNVRLFEMAKVYIPNNTAAGELPDERNTMTLGMYGDGDFFTMKGVVESILKACGLTKRAEYDANADVPFLHPGRKADVVYDGKKIGYLGEVHPVVATNYGVKERIYLAVIDMPTLTELSSFDKKFTSITKLPASTRDLSMVVPKEISLREIEKVFDSKGGGYLESYELFDIYEGSQIKEGFKSIAFSLIFRGKEKSLEESDVSSAIDRIVKALEGKGIELRK